MRRAVKRKSRTGKEATVTRRGRPSPPETPSKLQMEDIARLAGVHVSTVSRALAGSSRVNEETRVRIEELARSVNYSINVGARNLRLQKNRTVAVVVPYDAAARQPISDPFFMCMLSGLADALTERGYDMLLSRIDAERLDLAGELAASGRAIGVILIGQWHHHDQLNELAVRRTPIAVWGAQLAQQLYCTVGTDNVAGGTVATEHLLDLGRKRIAFFGDTTLPEVAQRYEGYCKALADRGIRVDPSLVLRTPFLQGSAQRAVASLLESSARFDGLFASSDLLAMGAIGALRDRGRQVPADVAVVGYDDIELARYFHPSLSTVRQPVVEGAAALVESLLAITNGERPKPKVIASKLVIRASSGGENEIE